MLGMFVQGLGVDTRQTGQFAAAEPGQDAAHAQRQQQINHGHPGGDAARLVIAVLAHAQFGIHEGIQLAADFVKLVLPRPVLTAPVTSPLAARNRIISCAYWSHCCCWY
jgi:hypothetical protein